MIINKIWKNLDYYVREDLNEPLKGFFKINPNLFGCFSQESINYCNLLEENGQDLSNLPRLYLLPKEREKLSNIPIHDCHNFSREILYYLIEGQKLKAQLWWGYAEAYKNDTCLGMFCHSFITVLCQGALTIYDPFAILFAKECTYTSYYGICLPHDFIFKLHPQNHSAYIKNIVADNGKLEEFTSMLKENPVLIK